MRILIITFVITVLFSGCIKKETPYDLKYPVLKYTAPTPSPYRHVLDNGITVFIVEDNKLPVFDIHARFRLGGLMESTSEKGLSSLTADMLEEGGTKSIPSDSLDELLEFHAISLSSGADFTGAMVSLSCISDKIDLGFQLFNKTIEEPAFEEKKLAILKQRSMEAISHRFDEPGNTLRIAGRYALYGKNKWSELLSIKDLNKATRPEIVKFYEKNYRPENMIIGVSGRFVAKDILEKLNSTIGKWKKSGIPETTFPKLDMDAKKRLYFIEKDINQAYVRIGVPLSIIRPNPDYYPLILMNWVLGGASFTSRISKKVREEEGLAYDAGSSVSCEYFYPGSFNVGLQTKSASTAYAIDLVFKEITKFLASGALDTELAAGKQSLIDAFPSSLKDGDRMAKAFTYNQYVKESDDNIKDYCDRIRAVTLDDVRRVAKTCIQPESLSIIIVGRFAECEKGDNTHKVSLADFGQFKKFTEKELGKILGDE